MAVRIAANVDSDDSEANGLGSQGIPPPMCRSERSNSSDDLPYSDEVFIWRWEHRTGFRNYDQRTSAKIEAAYQCGEAKVSVKSGKKGKKPLIIFFLDMLQFDPTTENTRRIQRVGRENCCRRIRRFFTRTMHAFEHGRPEQQTFLDYKQRRKFLMDPTATLHQATTNHYHHKRNSRAAKIVKHPWFDHFTMFAVFANAIWIAYEADNNDAASITSSKPVFIVVENIFCVIFTAEVVLRVASFQVKWNCFKDCWFRFDLALVILMILETWIIPLCMLAADAKNDDGGKLGNLSVLRLARLIRLARVSRLVRWAPEMVTLLKAIAAAMRSVLFTILLLIILLFVFGIVFKTFEGMYPDLKKTEFFVSVRRSMWTLLLHGLFLDEIADCMNTVHDASNDFVCGVFLLFIFLGAFTILNMLIGFQCEMAARVAQKDKENAEVTYLQHNLIPILDCYDEDGSKHLEKAEFTLILQDPQVVDIISRYGADVRDLLNLRDIIYEDKKENARVKAARDEDRLRDAGIDEAVKGESFYEARISFAEFIEVVLRLRGKHPSSVTDIVELREYLRQRLEKLEELQRTGGAPVAEAPSRDIASAPGADQGDNSQPPEWALKIVKQLELLNKKVDKLTALAVPASATGLVATGKPIGITNRTGEAPFALREVAEAGGKDLVQEPALDKTVDTRMATDLLSSAEKA